MRTANRAAAAASGRIVVGRLKVVPPGGKAKVDGGRIGAPYAPGGNGEVAGVGLENVGPGWLKEPVGVENVGSTRLNVPVDLEKVVSGRLNDPSGVEKVDAGRLNVPSLTGICGGTAGENVVAGRLKV